jgi:superfamily II DNA or RNA helicase
VITLRPYQNDTITAATSAYRAGHRGVLVVIPTGGGKTVIYSEVTRAVAAAGAAVLIVEPAVELVEQTRDKLRALGVPRVGIIAAGWGRGYNPDAGALVQVATVQTLRTRPDAMLRTPHLIVFDEAHLSAAESYRMIRERYPRAVRLGVTATPWRLDGAGFEDLASEIIVGPTVRDLIGTGALVPFRTRSIPLTAFARGTRRPNSEFNLREMSKAYTENRLVGDVVAHYLDSPKAGRSGIVFGASTGHARELCDRFVAAGVRAEYLDGTTPADVRRAIVGTPEKPGRLGTGETTLVCNFGVLTAGFDCPRVEYIGVARATASKALWIQMAGRGMRPSPATGKIDALIDDFGGNALRHGNLARVHDYSLTGRNAADEGDGDPDAGPLGRECPQCRTVDDAGAAVCAFCGFEFAILLRAGRGRVKSIDGHLVEIAADAEPLELVPPETADERATRIARHAGAYLRDRASRKADAFGERFERRAAS